MVEFNFSKKKIKQERSLGDHFKRTRKRKKYNLEQVEKETKVSMKYLKAIEEGNFEVLPAEIYVHGFINRYADFLVLDRVKMIQKYQDELKIYKSYGIFKVKKEKKQSDIIKPQRGKKWLKTPDFVVTPKLIVSSLVLLVVMGIMSYIWYQVRSFAVAPPLEIFSPSIEEVVQADAVIVEGKTDLGAVVTINNELVAIDAEGNFSQEIKLEPGLNNLEIISKNKTDKITKRTLRVLAEYEVIEIIENTEESETDKTDSEQEVAETEDAVVDKEEQATNTEVTDLDKQTSGNYDDIDEDYNQEDTDY